jgi:hypothetical protein
MVSCIAGVPKASSLVFIRAYSSSFVVELISPKELVGKASGEKIYRNFFQIRWIFPDELVEPFAQKKTKGFVMSLLRSNLSQLTDPETFHWMVGIEDTFIVEPWPQTNRILDEYELTGHYEHFREDIGLMAHLGVKMVRYGLPWYRINPSANQWNWEWADGPLEFLLYHHIDPIIDLVHYGLPSWIKGVYENPDYPKYVAEYAFRVAERYKGLVHCYTPLNEPRITAWYCGKLGWWPPHRKGWKGFVKVMLGVCRGIVHTAASSTPSKRSNPSIPKLSRSMLMPPISMNLPILRFKTKCTIVRKLSFWHWTSSAEGLFLAIPSTNGS